MHHVTLLDKAYISWTKVIGEGDWRAAIYAAIYDWKDCEVMIEKFREHNMTNRDSPLRVEYKYGPLTTKRRSLALNKRRTLK